MQEALQCLRISMTWSAPLHLLSHGWGAYKEGYFDPPERLGWEPAHLPPGLTSVNPQGHRHDTCQHCLQEGVMPAPWLTWLHSRPCGSAAWHPPIVHQHLKGARDPTKACYGLPVLQNFRKEKKSGSTTRPTHSKMTQMTYAPAILGRPIQDDCPDQWSGISDPVTSQVEGDSHASLRIGIMSGGYSWQAVL